MEPEAESSASSSEDELDALKPPSWKTRNTAVKIIDITSAGPQCVDLSYIASNGVKNMVEGEIAAAKTQDPIEKEQLENCMAENLVQFMKESGTKFPLSSEADTLSTKAEGHVLDNLSQPVSELPHETEVPKKDIGCQTFGPASVSNGHTVGCQTTGTGDIISLNLYYENSPGCKLMTASIHGQNNQTACDNMTLQDFENVLDVLQGNAFNSLKNSGTTDKETQYEEIDVRKASETDRKCYFKGRIIRIAITYLFFIFIVHCTRNVIKGTYFFVTTLVCDTFRKFFGWF